MHNRLGKIPFKRPREGRAPYPKITIAVVEITMAAIPPPIYIV
jgi:hypothetical protein